MNRRAFFTTIVAACGIPVISEIRHRIRMREVAAVLRLKDELSAGIKKANAQLKKMAFELELKESEEITRVFAGHTHGGYMPSKKNGLIPARHDEVIIAGEAPGRAELEKRLSAALKRAARNARRFHNA